MATATMTATKHPNILDELEALEKSMPPSMREVNECNSRSTMGVESARQRMADEHDETRRKAYQNSIVEREAQRIVYDPIASRDAMIRLTARRGELRAALTSVNADMAPAIKAKCDSCLTPELFLKLQECTAARNRIDALLRRIAQSEAELGAAVPPSVASARTALEQAAKVAGQIEGAIPGVTAYLIAELKRLNLAIATKTWSQLAGLAIEPFTASSRA